MNHVGKFPVRDHPISDESLHGYLLRLADNNGRFTAIEVLSLLGLSRSPSNIHISELAAPLSIALDTDKSIISEWFQAHIYLFEGRDIKIVSMHISDPKICLECLNTDKDAYIRNDWSLIPVTCNAAR